MDNGEDVLLLLGAEVVYFARDLTIDVAGVDHQYFVAVSFGSGAVEKPQFARDGTGIEKVGANGDHCFYVAGFYQFLQRTLASPLPALDAWEDMTKPARPVSFR